MKKLIIAAVVVGALLSFIFMLSDETSRLNAPVYAASMVKEEATQYFTEVLEQQKTDFEQGTPLANTELSKLSETDDAVRIFFASTNVDHQVLNRFTYEVTNVHVYNKDGLTYADAQVIRRFEFEPAQAGSEVTPTSLTDKVTIQLNDFGTDRIALEQLIYTNHSDDASTLDLATFMGNYRNETMNTN